MSIRSIKNKERGVIIFTVITGLLVFGHLASKCSISGMLKKEGAPEEINVQAQLVDAKKTEELKNKLLILQGRIEDYEKAERNFKALKEEKSKLVKKIEALQIKLQKKESLSREQKQALKKISEKKKEDTHRLTLTNEEKNKKVRQLTEKVLLLGKERDKLQEQYDQLSTAHEKIRIGWLKKIVTLEDQLSVLSNKRLKELHNSNVALQERNQFLEKALKQARE